MGMYKKNSILDRPIRPPSARNVENGPIEHARAIEAQKRLAERFRRYESMEGYSSRHQWADPGHLYTTSYDNLHRLQTVVTDQGLKTVPRSDVDVRSGVMRVPAPWDRAENFSEDPAAECAWPPSPGRGVSPSGAFRPQSPGTRSPRLLRDHRFAVPEDDPNDLATQRRATPPPAGLDGTYDPITHRWVVEPADSRALDREAMPPGQRSKSNLYHP